jgi:hypothetical protein
MSAARRLVFVALALRGVDIVLGPWGSPPQVLSLLWALVLTLTAIALRARPRAATGVVLFVAFVSVVNAIGIVRNTSDELEFLVPFFQVRRAIWLGEAALLVAAPVAAVGARVEVRRHEVARTPWQSRRALLTGAACWSAALGVIFWWPGNPWVSYALAPLIPIALGLRFLLARRLGRADAMVARVAGWMGVACCLLTLTPIAYGLVIVYLLMTARGTAIFALALVGTFALLAGAGALRRSMKSRFTSPDVANAGSPSS